MIIWGITRAAPADMVYRTQFKIEFLMLPTPPKLLSQVKTMLAFHCVSSHTLFKDEESTGGKAKISIDVAVVCALSNGAEADPGILI